MKNIKLFSYAVTLLSLLAFSPLAKATPITILDTGPGPVTSSGYALGSNQWFAVRFTMPEVYVITDIFGWIYTINGSGLTVAVYGDGGSVPDQSNEIFSILTFHPDRTLNWFGASDLDLVLDPGNYWVAFEVRPGDSFAGSLPNPSENPSSYEAFSPGFGDNANTYTTFPIGFFANIGVQIFARENQASTEVPEPTTALLLALGSAFYFARKRQWQNS